MCYNTLANYSTIEEVKKMHVSLIKEKGYWRIKNEHGHYFRSDGKWGSSSPDHYTYQDTHEGKARKFLQEHGLIEKVIALEEKELGTPTA